MLFFYRIGCLLNAVDLRETSVAVNKVFFHYKMLFKLLLSAQTTVWLNVENVRNRCFWSFCYDVIIVTP